MIRKIVLLVTVLWLTFSITGSGANDTPDSLATAIPDQIALSWTGNPSTTMTITWWTDTTVTSGFIQYRKGATVTKNSLQVKAEARGFVTDLSPTRLFSVSYFIVEASDMAAIVKAIQLDGTVLDAFTIEKTECNEYKIRGLGGIQLRRVSWAPLKNPKGI